MNGAAGGNTTCRDNLFRQGRKIGMRQSRKEAKIERMNREGLNPERREAMFLMEMAPAEFADDFAGHAPGGFRGGRRPSPGGRG